MASLAPNIKRLVDLVDRDQVDATFYPVETNSTLFHRPKPRPYHNMVPEIVEIGYQGNAAWGQRITVNLTRQDSGDMLQWLCLRLSPRSWLGGDLDAKMQTGLWQYQDPSAAWSWADSLGTAAIQLVEFEIGDAIIETWPGEWMEVWSRMWLDAGRSGSWDADIYARNPQLRNPLSYTQPTEDGYIYCWLPLALLRRPQTAFPLVAMGTQEVRVHITLRPFHEVLRPPPSYSKECTTPLGETIVLLDKTGDTPIPWQFTLPNVVPGFEDATVFVGVTHMEDPMRRRYMGLPMEIMYEPVSWAVFDIPSSVRKSSTLLFPLRQCNGPTRELCFFLQTKDGSSPLISARLMVGNAVWRDEAEAWWRLDYGLAHRGGVRMFNNFMYGTVLGDAAGWTAEDFQPAGTVNASRADMRLDLTLQDTPTAYKLYVFGIGLNWLRIDKGMAVPVFRD